MLGFCLRFEPPAKNPPCEFLRVNVFAPRLVKLLSKLCLSASVALKMPTSAMMPNEMINEVSTVLSGDALIADQDKERVSEKALVFMGLAVG